jgi:hypothetical protein
MSRGRALQSCSRRRRRSSTRLGGRHRRRTGCGLSHPLPTADIRPATITCPLRRSVQCAAPPAGACEGEVAKGGRSVGLPSVAGLRDAWDRLRGRPPRPRVSAQRVDDRGGRAADRPRVRRVGVRLRCGGRAGRAAAGERTAGRFRFRRTELPLLRDAIVVHNHPIEPGVVASTLTFSTVDLALAIRYDLAELRAVAADWRFTLRRPPTGWPADEEIVLAAYDEQRRFVEAELTAALAEGRITVADYGATLAHETIRRVAVWGRMAYRREHAPWR